MILLYKDLIKFYKSDYEIKKLIKEKKIFKIAKGIYSEQENANYLEIITIFIKILLKYSIRKLKKYPQLIISTNMIKLK